ncbi:hypothetical protein WISP_01268 [Willisornis vidua]|uniref:Uncharacterized protein n=1 Tax=Willisornis vidua TaxID=1566151 RepID=A0ABQ9E0W5_9PASS|nr:hypothetical protein WISP_01268 [Willisornis vidua]
MNHFQQLLLEHLRNQQEQERAQLLETLRGHTKTHLVLLKANLQVREGDGARLRERTEEWEEKQQEELQEKEQQEKELWEQQQKELWEQWEKEQQEQQQELQLLQQ